MDEVSRSLEEALKQTLTSPRAYDVRDLYCVSLVGHASTGFTTHWKGGKILPKPASSKIAHVGSDPGFYLFYLDELGEELTDTYHTDLEGAFEQANAEFGVDRHEWLRSREP